jgi:8-oxo-dGTP diphosphatase
MFIIRVYGIYIHQERVLVCDEYWFDTPMTKFPGGGLEYGEGPVDCLMRECQEELGQKARVLSHFYTTDFFQPTLFINDKQLISLYYLIDIENPDSLQTSVKAFDFEPAEGALSLRWIPLGEISSAHMTLPIDKLVADMIKNIFTKTKKQLS